MYRRTLQEPGRPCASARSFPATGTGWPIPLAEWTCPSAPPKPPWTRARYCWAREDRSEAGWVSGSRSGP